MNANETSSTQPDQYAEKRKYIENLLQSTFHENVKLVDPDETEEISASDEISCENLDDQIPYKTEQFDAQQKTEVSTVPQNCTNGQIKNDRGDKENPNDILAVLDADAQSCGCSAIKKIYYDVHRKDYLIKNADGIWMAQTTEQCRRLLKSFGFTSRKAVGQELSLLDHEIMRINDQESVVYVGSIAGMKEGFYNNGQKILVTDSPRLITPKNGSWNLLEAVFQAVLKDDKFPQDLLLWVVASRFRGLIQRETPIWASDRIGWRGELWKIIDTKYNNRIIRRKVG